MNPRESIRLLKEATGLRNIVFITLGGSIAMNFLLAVALATTKNTHTETFVPPFIQGEFWVDDTKVSASYLRGMSLYLFGLAFNQTPATAGALTDQLLTHVSPDVYGQISKQLRENAKRIKDDNVTTWFTPQSVEVKQESMSAVIIGYFNTAVAGRQIGSEERIYQLKYTRSSSGVKLASITQLNLRTVDVGTKMVTELTEEEKINMSIGIPPVKSGEAK